MQEAARILRKRDERHWAQQPRVLDGINSPYYSASSVAVIGKPGGTLPTVHEGILCASQTDLPSSSSTSMVSKLDSLVIQTGYLASSSKITSSPNPNHMPQTAVRSDRSTDGSHGHAKRLAPEVKRKVEAFKFLGRVLVAGLALVGCVVASAAIWALTVYPGAAAAVMGTVIVSEALFFIHSKQRYVQRSISLSNINECMARSFIGMLSQLSLLSSCQGTRR